MIHRQIEFPYVHDLVGLLELVEKCGQKAPDSVRQAARITRYAVATRYPGVLDPVTRSCHRDDASRDGMAEAVRRYLPKMGERLPRPGLMGMLQVQKAKVAAMGGIQALIPARYLEPVEGRLLLFDLRVMADTFGVLMKVQGL